MMCFIHSHRKTMGKIYMPCILCILDLLEKFWSFLFPGDGYCFFLNISQERTIARLKMSLQMSDSLAARPPARPSVCLCGHYQLPPSQNHCVWRRLLIMKSSLCRPPLSSHSNISPASSHGKIDLIKLIKTRQSIYGFHPSISQTRA